MTVPHHDSLCWTDGQVRRLSDLRIDPRDRGFTLGDGLFETMLWTERRIRFFDDHMARLSHSADMLDLAIPATPDEIETGLTALVRQSGLDRAALRLTLSRGPGPRGLALPEEPQPRLLATVAPCPTAFDPVSVCLVDVARAVGAPSARFKTLSYLDQVMALNLARAAGADEALMRGHGDRIACASSANVLIRLEGVWLTPPVADGALPGIVRGRLIRAGLIDEKSLGVADLNRCDAACLTNALIGVRPVHQLNGRKLAVVETDIVGMRDALANGSAART